jgi:hypothetical protein
VIRYRIVGMRLIKDLYWVWTISIFSFLWGPSRKLPTVPELKLLNIQWRLKSQLFKDSCLFKGQSVQQGLTVATLKIILCKQLRNTFKIS